LSIFALSTIRRPNRLQVGSRAGYPKAEEHTTVAEPTAAELRRLSLPPHNRASGLRLACQVSVLGDIEVTKFEGFFGQRTDAPKIGPDRTR
jgi:hypothetical protein